MTQELVTLLKAARAAEKAVKVTWRDSGYEKGWIYTKHIIPSPKIITVGFVSYLDDTQVELSASFNGMVDGKMYARLNPLMIPIGTIEEATLLSAQEE